MLTQIDHIVIIANDLDNAINGARKAGFTVVPGGEHSGGETRNAIIAFQDGTYVELISFINAAPDANHYFSERLRKGEGLADFALLSTNLVRDVADVTARGVEFPAPSHLGRNRPDGVRIEWEMSLPLTLTPGKGYPFFIQDTTDRSLRVPCDPDSTIHANGTQGVAGVSVVVHDLDEAAEAFRAIIDAPEEKKPLFGPRTRGILRLRLPCNAFQWIALMQVFPDSAPLTYIQRFGPGPYAVNLLRNASNDVYPGEGTLIDPDLMCGARFYL